jgi:hypothetical protein
MSLVVTSIEVKHCEEEGIACDGILYWLSIANKLDSRTKEMGVGAWGWGASIKLTEQYLVIEMVDDEDGEVNIMKIKITMHNYFEKCNLYPQPVKIAMDKFTNELKNKNWY